jgi:cell division protein FtsW (lipid II flippase)
LNKYCTQCSFPINGTEEEKRSFRLSVSSRKRLLSDAEDKIKNARYIIYALAALFFVSGIILGVVNDDFVTMIVNLFICVLYLILAAWCTKNPFGAFLTAFIIYVTLIVVNAFFNPATLLSGLVMKIICIGALITGIRSAKEAQGYLSELEKVKAVPNGYN